MRETVSDDELRIILERLGQEEFGGEPATTVQDIVEGTGADPIMIGRILADVRKEEFEKRFGLQLKHHEQRIEEHEERIEKIEKDDRKPNVTVIQQTVISPPPPPRPIPKRDDNRFFQEFDEPESLPIAKSDDLAGEDIDELKSIAKERRRERQLAPLYLAMIVLSAIVLFYTKGCEAAQHVR